jgi:hypothetical protein
VVLDLRQLVICFPPGYGHVGHVVDNVALGRSVPNTSVSPVNSCFTEYSTLIMFYHPGAGTVGQAVADVPS